MSDGKVIARLGAVYFLVLRGQIDLHANKLCIFEPNRVERLQPTLD